MSRLAGPPPAVLRLPSPDGTLVAHRPSGRSAPPPPDRPATIRVAFAAAHIVADPLRSARGVPAADSIDWDATLAYRRHLWRYGLGVAEAMDTAQRGMGLDADTALELIRRSVSEAADVGGRVVCGVGTDQLRPGASHPIEAVRSAYERQCEAVEAAGGRIVLMASRALARAARSADEYVAVYGDILDGLREPAIIHWLGEMFDPSLAGYWGSPDPRVAMATCLAIIRDHREAVDGVKISLLSAELEIEMRRQLPAGVRMYSGDDFNYPDLILGDREGHSDALLGILDPIAPAAAAALAALERGDVAGYRDHLDPTLALARHVFEDPTSSYKTGVVFLAHLNGHQGHVRLVDGQESARSVLHLARLYALADEAGLFLDPDAAAARMRAFLTSAGIG